MTAEEAPRTPTTDDLWRFEPETFLMQALELHYEGEHDHADTERCAIDMLDWLRTNGAYLVNRYRIPLHGERAHGITAGCPECRVQIDAMPAAAPSGQPLDVDMPRNRGELAAAIFEAGIKQTMGQSTSAAEAIIAEVRILRARLAESSEHPEASE